MQKQNVVVVGASGAIGCAFVQAFCARNEVATVFALSRSGAGSTSYKVISCRVD